MRKALKTAVDFIFSYQFSKILMLMETFVVLYLVKHCVELAFLAVQNQFSGALPWITTMITQAFAAYMASAACYYHKSGKEQVAKIEKFGIESPVIGIDIGDKPTI